MFELSPDVDGDRMHPLIRDGLMRCCSIWPVIVRKCCKEFAIWKMGAVFFNSYHYLMVIAWLGLSQSDHDSRRWGWNTKRSFHPVVELSPFSTAPPIQYRFGGIHNTCGTTIYVVGSERSIRSML